MIQELEDIDIRVVVNTMTIILCEETLCYGPIEEKVDLSVFSREGHAHGRHLNACNKFRLPVAVLARLTRIGIDREANHRS